MISKYKKVLNSSFRDPSGFLFEIEDTLYRQINKVYQENYDLLVAGGLYGKLVEENYLVEHEEIDLGINDDNAYKYIKPKSIEFISYPYEWSLSQYKDAALLTLQIQKTALDYGMSLKDASAYNVQFLEGKPIFIDTLSFEKLNELKPWVAYKQFCQHFLAPIAIMCKTDVRLSSLMKNYIDGIPLDLASKLIPKFTKLGIITNIHLHAKSQKKYENVHDKSASKTKFSKFYHQAMIDGLESLIRSLKWEQKETEWGEYYTFTNYNDDSFENKKLLVKEFIGNCNPKYLWDIGANQGTFSRIASSMGIKTVAFDIDPIAVEKNYLEIKKRNEKDILPLILDITNPSPAIGWANCERDSWMQRNKADTVMALALIHHLAISNNIPLFNIARFLSEICQNLIIEFIPKEDSQLQKLLSTRDDIFSTYNKEQFEQIFNNIFHIKAEKKIGNTSRVLYLMQKR